MADLIAQGTESQHRWRRPLKADESFVLGRTAPHWSVPWDATMSRRHAELCWRDGVLHVRRLPSGRNPIFYHGQQAETFEVAPGEHFVIGETRFAVSADEASVDQSAPRPLEEQAFSSQYLQRVRFRNADQRMEVLSRLPEVISGAEKDSELFLRLVNMVLAGIPRAGAVALVIAAPDARHDSPVNVVHWDRRLTAEGAFQPSRKLIVEAVRRQESVLHVWADGMNDSRGPGFTMSANFDWAFCTPVPGAACAGWGLYVAGQFGGPAGAASPVASQSTDLREDLKFTEIVAATLSSLRRLGELQHRQAMMSQFFPPAVMDALEAHGQDVLAPRETDVAVLFCDLRGFSRKAERDAEDLMGLLQRVSKALGVMTHHILDQGGAVGDFLGDAALGFWGWPLSADDDIVRACLAALAIRTEFEAAAQRPDHPLADFRVGIGLATGRAVAGGIGTPQRKFTVFGPVVNLASRLEGMTKILHAPILIDEATARMVRQQVPAELARSRRVAVVQPVGMDKAVEVSELLPPAAEDDTLTDEHLQFYEQALDHFLSGSWTEAMELLQQVPARDRVKDFLTVFIAQHNRTPPEGWNGVIPLTRKS